MTDHERDTQEAPAQAAPDEPGHEGQYRTEGALVDRCARCGRTRAWHVDPTLYAELAHVAESELRALWGDR